MAHHDVIIVGSGFGGAVIAARWGRHLKDLGGGSVLLLERGNDHTGAFDPASDGGPVNTQDNRFRQTLAPDYLADVGHVYTDPTGAYQAGKPSMQVITGKGLGGGSNVYLGVSLRAPTEVFERTEHDLDGERRIWPSMYSRQSLRRYYARAEAQLDVHRMHWTSDEVPHWQLATRRDWVFAEGCRRIGATAAPLKLATTRDANEGWWSQGQRFRGRNNLTHNYLLDAYDAGVQMHTGCEVESVAPDGDGYVVSGVDRRGGEDTPFTHTCDILVMAAGCVASAGLLLRNEGAFTGDRVLDLGADQHDQRHLGQHLSGNGDYGVSGIVGPDFERDVHGHRGKPMSSFCPTFWPTHQFILIPFYAAPLYLAQGFGSGIDPAQVPTALGRGSTTVKAGEDGRPTPHWGLAYKQRMQQFGPRMLTMGCLTLDEGEGEVTLGPTGTRFEVRWPHTHGATEARWSAAVDTMRRIYEALGGEMFLDSYRKDGTVSTAHPLAAVRMSDEPDKGIVDAFGESHQNRNLFVVDGSIVPCSLGVNPSLTITAVAEMIAEKVMEGEGTESLASRLGR